MEAGGILRLGLYSGVLDPAAAAALFVILISRRGGGGGGEERDRMPLNIFFCSEERSEHGERRSTISSPIIVSIPGIPSDPTTWWQRFWRFPLRLLAALGRGLPLRLLHVAMVVVVLAAIVAVVVEALPLDVIIIVAERYFLEEEEEDKEDNFLFLWWWWW